MVVGGRMASSRAIAGKDSSRVMAGKAILARVEKFMESITRGSLRDNQ